ncbi:MAG: response regulator [Anaerocolumna sp.]
MNILLVDDEVAVIQILKRAIQWETLGISQVFTAYNAQEAKRIVVEEKIHIIISDIEMPQENGLHFLTWVQEIKPDIIYIILTGFPDFNYAKDAISIGVFKFLLKPVVFDELREVVKEAITKVTEEKKKEDQRRYGEYYESNRIKAEKIFYRDLVSEEILPFPDYIENEIRRRGMQEERLELGGMILFRVDRRERIEEKGAFLQFALKNIAEELFNDVVMIDFNKDILWMVKGKQSEEGLAEMSRVYLEKIQQYLQYELFAYLTGNIVLEEVSRKYKMLKQASIQYFKVNQRIYFAEQWFRGIVDEAYSKIGKNGRENEIVINTVREYLEEHYNEPINRKDVEELVHLNQDYLNRVFKCATGCTLMEYIQYYRILKAKVFLADMQKSISEIGGLVGYDSPPYFSKIFKKCTGITPVEYRNSLGEDGLRELE